MLDAITAAVKVGQPAVAMEVFKEMSMLGGVSDSVLTKALTMGVEMSARAGAPAAGRRGMRR